MGVRRDWELRAKQNPLYAIDASRRAWTLDDFYARGLELVNDILEPALARLGVDPTGKRVLEIGCGMGRLFPGLLGYFGEVWGIDISAEMIAKGKAHCPVDATWLHGDGRSLHPVKDTSVDHVLSYEVFQHIPDVPVIESYLAETWRVLRLGGTFQLQLRCGSDTRRQAVVRAMPRLMRGFVGKILQLSKVLPIGGHIDTWLGCVVSPEDLYSAARDMGFIDVAVMPDCLHPPGMGFWLVARRPAA